MKKLLLNTTLLIALTFVTTAFGETPEEGFFNGIDPKIVQTFKEVNIPAKDFLNSLVPNGQPLETEELQELIKSKIAERVAELGSFATCVKCCDYILDLASAQKELLTGPHFRYVESFNGESISLTIYPLAQKSPALNMKDYVSFLINLVKTNLLLVQQQIERKFVNLQELVNWIEQLATEVNVHWCEQKIEFLKNSLNATDLLDSFKMHLEKELAVYETKLKEYGHADSVSITVPILQGLTLMCVVKQVVDQKTSVQSDTLETSPTDN